MPSQQCHHCPHTDATCATGSQPPCGPSGILNLDKPADWTSHDVVARVRRLTSQRQVGHAGTLDPFATGVLLLCLGQATRVSEYLLQAPKLYHARVRFGAATDTYDATGTIIAQAHPPHSLEPILALLPRFTGRIRQVPPPYSALKVGGAPAYRRARRGETVVLAAREVQVYRLQVLAWEPPDLVLEIECGRGTYIRSLAHDLGLAAGSAAHLTALRRQAIGSFRAEDAISLPDLEKAVSEGNWIEHLHPLDEALLHYPALIVDAPTLRRVQQGQPFTTQGPIQAGLARVYGPSGEFVALVQGDVAAGLWRPHKVFLCV